ncbi:2-iminobutanoate/2-iminopropanoate deaminase [Pseudomonas jinjuensis]|uniref:2-iminobutanoate/2-iminopropanoate deaminase n=2 Tax=Pseudomonas jinjuensis TaxID=198616 RepID=A0A1H0CVV9_9PSED|nr:2-iminobutanoate/2-iminopropanoate deaminase [Pseudomonas jinjuensis]
MRMNNYASLIVAVALVGLVTATHAASEITAHAAQEEKQSSVERKNYEAPTPPGRLFSQAVKHGNVLYVSGITAIGTEAQGKRISEQARAIFSKLRAIAKAEGVDLSSLIKVTIFVTDMSQAAELRQELSSQYSGQPPASSLIEVKSLFSPEANIEIEAIIGL